MAHSPTAGGLSHVLDVGAMVRIWDSVMVVRESVTVLTLGLELVLWRGLRSGWAVVTARRRVRGVRRCILGG